MHSRNVQIICFHSFYKLYIKFCLKYLGNNLIPHIEFHIFLSINAISLNFLSNSKKISNWGLFDVIIVLSYSSDSFSLDCNVESYFG